MTGSYPGGGYGYPGSGQSNPSQSPNGSQPSPDDTYGSTPSTQPNYPAPSNRPNEHNGRAADSGVQVLDIQLTPEYTILYMSYTERAQPRYDTRTGKQISNHVIEIDPGGRLIAANGARAFRFVKAEGIPVKPKQLGVFSGQRVDFAVYFERLDKGLEHFDLFECNDTDQFVCWNIYDLFVDNPADPVSRPAPRPSRPQPNYPQAPSQSGGEVAVPTAPVSTAFVVTGTVRDAKTNRPVSATIDYKLSSSRFAVDSVQSFASTGAYRMALDRGQVYTYVASARGYRVGTGTLDLSKIPAGQKFTRDIVLTPLAVGDKIALKNIYFEMSKSDLLPASFAELNQIATMLQDNPAMTIRLEGHTDIIGDHDKNLQLSKDRVWACQEYLAKQGIDRNRVQAIGYGDTRPILTKGTDEERKVNRRVEFVILTL